MKIKVVLADFGSEKQFKAKKILFPDNRNWSNWREVTKHTLFELT